MAGGLNKATLIGNLGRDPEMRYTQSGVAVANFNIATSETWTNKEGEKETRTEWHKIVAWGKKFSYFVTRAGEVVYWFYIRIYKWRTNRNNYCNKSSLCSN